MGGLLENEYNTTRTVYEEDGEKVLKKGDSFSTGRSWNRELKKIETTSAIKESLPPLEFDPLY